MTNIEALESITSFTANVNLKRKVLEDLTLDPDGLYNSQDTIDLASARVCSILYKNPDFSEGSLNVKRKTKEMVNYANAIFERLNKQNEKIITNQIKFL